MQLPRLPRALGPNPTFLQLPVLRRALRPIRGETSRTVKSSFGSNEVHRAFGWFGRSGYDEEDSTGGVKRNSPTLSPEAEGLGLVRISLLNQAVERRAPPRIYARSNLNMRQSPAS